MQQEVKRAQVRELEPLDFTVTDSFKMFLDAIGRDLLNQHRIIFRLESYQSDVRGIALIAGAGVRDLEQLDAGQV